jgi:outer membrane biosynthesis protein TonB
MRLQILFCIAYGLSVATYPIHGQTSISPKASLSFTTDPQAPLGSETHPARVSSGIVAGHAIHQPKPIYPSGTITSGGIVVRILINPEGKVARAETISGREPLRAPALDAIRQWTYKPILLNESASWIETVVTIVW